ncbi:phosphohistidine phosphatase SixA [Gilvimarinus polysaccharolyticus]|uniref:phosphohistidine phosphatase SixA n=1 Tax=Gilvimarinus polysaccharolyticus TaxID=863921 RepID=UPI00067345E6|nr:phosphohistidine phosphatase SixA [Gilvimarinus polysaccharolyticus]
MRLFLLRHGRAEPFLANDASRALVASGREDVRNILTRKRDAMSAVTDVWVSPYVRARQSAEIALDVLGLSAQCERVSDLIVPEARVGHLIDALYESGLESVLLVSHQPLASTLLDTLCGSSAAHDMRTASLAAVELDVVAADMGRLQWLLHP